MDKFGIMRVEGNGIEVPIGQTFKTRRQAQNKLNELALYGTHQFRIVSIEEYRESMQS